MPRHARGTRYLGVIVASAWLSSISLGEPQESSPGSLALRVQAEAQSPIRVSPGSFPKPSVLKDWGTPAVDEDSAFASENEILDLLKADLPRESRYTAPDRAAIDQASRIAEQARIDLEKGNLAEASRLYRESLRLNPASAPVWSEFASVLEQQSNAIAAKSAYAEAIALGDRTFTTLLHFGLLAGEFREDRAAIAALLRASSLQDEQENAAGFVLSATLADALARNGYFRAALTHYARLLDLPAAFNESTPYRDRLNEVYRSRRELMWDAVEVSHRISDWENLDRFLTSTEALPGPQHPLEAAIRCYALVRTGRPATAASFLISTLGDNLEPGETVALLGYLAEQSDLRTELDAAIIRRADSMSAEDRLKGRQGLVLARAAIAGSESFLLDHLRQYPTDRSVWLQYLENEPAAGVTSILEFHPCLEPELTAVALALHGPIETDTPTALGLRSSLRQGDFAKAMSTYLDTQTLPTDEQPQPRIHYERLSLGVELLVDAYRGAEADRLLDAAARQASDGSERLAVAAALILRNRHRDALGLLEQEKLAEQVPPALVSSLTARARMGLGDRSGALAAVRRALQQDPADYDAAAYLIELGELQDAAANLQSVPGAEALLRLVRAINAIEREQFDLADRLLREAWQSPLRADEAASRLVNLLESNGAIAAADEWLQHQIERYPDRTDLVVLRSALLRTDRRPEEALDLVLNAHTIRQGSPALSRELEVLLRDEFDAEDRWLSQARSRLVNAPSTFATFLERSSVELAADKIDQAISLAELAADLSPSPLPSEQVALSELLDDISGSIINQPRVPAGAIDGFVRVFERLERPSKEAWRGRISVASIDRDTDEDGMIQLAVQASESLPEFAEEAFMHAAQSVLVAALTGQSLMDEEGARQAATLIYTAGTQQLEPYPTKLLAAWIDYSMQIQDPFVLGEAIRSLGDTQGPQDLRLRQALNYRVNRSLAVANTSPNRLFIADSALYLASFLSLNGQFETAKALYEEGLRIQPEHAELNNDYGFYLLDRHEQIDRAIRMIELAYAQNPNSSHIVDSMGWVRYKQGQLADEIPPGGGEFRLGAVSLLRRAKTLSAQEDPDALNACFTTNHLGDALWASGQHEEAVRQWTEAIELAERASKGIRGIQVPLSLEIELQELITQATEKVRAAGEDRPPAIAPMLD